MVGVGRGLAAQDDLKMVHELAAVLNAEVGCSRPIAEGGTGWSVNVISVSPACC